MIIGAHSIIYSKDPEADRIFLRDVLGLPHVDVGEGWLIFGVPPAEVAVHPGEENDLHEFYLMCDDAEAFVVEMWARGVACAPVQEMGWGVLTQVTLPGGGKLGVYQPRHARPKTTGAAKGTKKPARRAAGKPAKKAVRGKVKAKPRPKGKAKPAKKTRTAKKAKTAKKTKKSKKGRRR